MINKKKYLLSIKPEDIDFELLIYLFATKTKKINGKIQRVEPYLNTYDEFDLLPGEYFNKTKIRTNAGLFIFNKLIVERDFKDVTGYWNETINDKKLAQFESILARALMSKEISKQQMDKYLDNIQWLSMKFHSVVSGSFTMSSLKPHPKVMEVRNKFIKDNKTKIDDGDVPTAIKLESIVLNEAKKQLDGDDGLNLYESGARGSFGNNFKNISALRGPVYNPILGKTEIITTNFMEGIAKKDIASYANGVIAGAYPKAVGTQDSGYLGKKLIALLQTVVIDDKIKDCGSKGYIVVNLNENNKNDFNYRYIIEGTKLTLLDNKNIDKYIGRTVKMRSPLYCVSKNLCQACSGTIHTNLDIQNIGLTSTRVASTLLNASMKRFHDTTAKMNEIDINKMSI